MAEQHALGRDPVDARRFDERVAVGAHRPQGMIIAEYQDDVRAILGEGRPGPPDQGEGTDEKGIRSTHVHGSLGPAMWSESAALTAGFRLDRRNGLLVRAILQFYLDRDVADIEAAGEARLNCRNRGVRVRVLKDAGM